MLEHYQDELEGMVVAVLHLVETTPELKGAVLRPAYYSLRSDWLSYPCRKPGKAPSLALVEAQVYQTETSVFRISPRIKERLKNNETHTRCRGLPGAVAVGGNVGCRSAPSEGYKKKFHLTKFIIPLIKTTYAWRIMNQRVVCSFDLRSISNFQIGGLKKQSKITNIEQILRGKKHVLVHKTLFLAEAALWL
jgi:hypothetical protein